MARSRTEDISSPSAMRLMIRFRSESIPPSELNWPGSIDPPSCLRANKVLSWAEPVNSATSESLLSICLGVAPSPFFQFRYFHIGFKQQQQNDRSQQAPQRISQEGRFERGNGRPGWIEIGIDL